MSDFSVKGPVLHAEVIAKGIHYVQTSESTLHDLGNCLSKQTDCPTGYH